MPDDEGASDDGDRSVGHMARATARCLRGRYGMRSTRSSHRGHVRENDGGERRSVLQTTAISRTGMAHSVVAHIGAGDRVVGAEALLTIGRVADAVILVTYRGADASREPTT